MKESQHTLFTLPNGLRCVHAPARGRASYIGICVNAGSRDERGHQGLAHFVEHTIFKGTQHRSSWHINNRMECIGGELNAYTTKEQTVVYTNAPLGYTARSLDLLADLVRYASFPPAELQKEKDVVIEEIYSYRDSPNEYVYDLFDEAVYAGSPLSHPILGVPESVKELTSADCREYVGGYYTPSNMTVFIVDDNTPSKAEKIVAKCLGDMPESGESPVRHMPEFASAFDKTVDEEGHQAHTIVGGRVCSSHSSERFALFLLNNLLGGPAMNSILNLEMREKRGLVYAVESSVSLMSDCGLMEIYFGCDPEQNNRCRKIAKQELQKLAENTLTANKFNKIRDQYLGQLLVSSDQLESMAIGLGRSLLSYNEIHDIHWTAERIKSVTPEQMRAVAERFVSQGISYMTIK